MRQHTGVAEGSLEPHKNGFTALNMYAGLEVEAQAVYKWLRWLIICSGFQNSEAFLVVLVELLAADLSDALGGSFSTLAEISLSVLMKVLATHG